MSTPTSTETSQGPNFLVKGQYIKDLSFENPHAPQSLLTASKPAIEVNVDLAAQKLQDNIYEMAMHITTRATSEGSVMFLADVKYAGIFQLINIPQEHIEPLLFVECPFVLFPYARRVISDITRDGGFPPLMLDPIDFHALYAQNRARKTAAAN